MKLKTLLQKIKGIELRGSKEIEITGICSNSKVAKPGDLFIARKGVTFNGADFILDAAQTGVRAVVTDIYDPFLKLPQIICRKPQELEAILAAKYYGSPSKKLLVIGVTGSKGKTTTSYMARHLLQHFEGKCALVGTIETNISESKPNFDCTTRDAIANQKLLREMVDQTCKAAVLEVSSHGVDQGRVAEIDFDIGIFTNLSVDHLDYHKTMEAYAKAKAGLFTDLKKGAIINFDSDYAEAVRPSKNVMTYGMAQGADVRGEIHEANEKGVSFSIEGVSFYSPMPALFNVYNMLAVISMGRMMGYPLSEMSEVLREFKGVEGRLQRVESDRNIHVFVDYAHSGPSLAQVLGEMRKLAKKQIIVVFGCGGNRDPMRRKLMGEAAEQGADLSIVTTDNCRNEAPESICKDILEGFSDLKNVIVELDRKKAIGRALSTAKEGDIVLIAGKGHEKVQIFSDTTVTFDDVALCKEML